MRTIVFGAKGQLGKDLMEVFSACGRVDGYDLPELDVGDSAAVEHVIMDTKPDWVINAAAFTDVEGAESRRDEAFRVNEVGARNIAVSAASLGVPVVYYSTDFVFGGDKRTPYEPDDPVSPQGVYAESKRAGEVAVLAGNSRAMVIRTAWLFGPGKNNFVEKIIAAAQTRPELRVVDDEVGSPTYTLDLAVATKELCLSNHFGIFHVVNSGSCSRYELACAIVRGAGLTTAVSPCKSNERPSVVRRPAYSVLSTKGFERVTGHEMRHWSEALREYLNRRQKRT